MSLSATYSFGSRERTAFIDVVLFSSRCSQNTSPPGGPSGGDRVAPSRAVWGKGPPLGAHSQLGDGLLSMAGPLVRPEAWAASPEGFPPLFSSNRFGFGFYKAISLENVRHVMGRQSRPGCHRGMGENFKTSSAFRSLLILSPGGDW